MRTITLFLAILTGLIPVRLFAAHLVGGDLSYKCVSSGRYEVTLVIYKDCYSSTPLDDPATITIFNKDNNTVRTTTISLDQSELLNNGPDDPCILNAPDVCLERGLYQSVIALSPNTNGYKIVYQRCCRNGSISNLFFPGETGSTYDVDIPGQALGCNSSPAFSDFPPSFLCAKSKFEFDFSAIDADGDSLVYSLTAPQQGASTSDPMPAQASNPPYGSVSYANGYTALKPFGSTSLINIDPVTGRLTCIPQQQGQFVVCIAVAEYRNGVYIGRITRDFQFNVTDCSSTSSIPSVVIDNANAIYQLDDTTFSSCNGLTVNFKNNSSGSILSNFWDFGDPAKTNDTSLLKDPVYTFADTGRYTVTLIVNRGQACGDTSTMEVRVYRELTGNFSFTSACVYNAVPFSDSSRSYYNDINAWKWYFGDGDSVEVQNPQHLYRNPGTFNVNLVATTAKGCKVKATKAVTVYPKPRANFTVPAVCLYAPVKITNTSTVSSGTITQYLWNYSGGTSTAKDPNLSFQTFGNNPVKLTVTSDKGCVDTLTKNVSALDSLRANFTINDSLFCKNTSAQFTSTSAGNSITHSWNFGDGGTATTANTSHIYPNPGNYQVQLVVSNAVCGRDTARKSIRVYDGLQTNFSVQPDCVYKALAFKDSSAATYNDINSYAWTFGDGGTSTAPNPTHQYGAPGTFNVTLTATTVKGCQSVKTGSVTVYPKPTANFNIPLICLNKPFTLTNTSTISSGSIAQNLWNYGSGQTSAAKDPTISFPVSGIFPVKLTVTSDKNCIDTITKNVDIQDSIRANFVFTDSLICKLNVTQLTSTSRGQNITHNWSFGDNTNSTLVNPTHQYTAPGTYPVTLKISNAACGTDSVTKPIRVFDGGLDVKWGAQNDCYYTALNFRDSAVALFNDITGYSWKFGDGDSANTANAAHQYLNPGTYSVSYTVTTARGCINTVTRNVEAYPKPAANFNAPVICIYKPFTLQNTSTITRGTIAQYDWDLGNGTRLSDVNPRHVLDQLGNYPIRLVAISDKGCRDSITKPIGITDSLRARFEWLPGIVCHNSTVQFIDSSIGTAISYQWAFGDGNVSTDSLPEHTYLQAQTYPVKLVVSSPTCGSDSLVKQLVVVPLPVVDLGTPVTLCPGNTELVRVNGRAYDSLVWSTGATTDTLSMSTDLDPLYVTVFKNGCPGTDTLKLIIDCPVYIPNAFTPNFDGLNDAFGLIDQNIQQAVFQVFNRWGQLLYETTDPARGWDGTYQGRLCLNDDYIYVAEGLTKDNKTFSIKGTFVLLR